MLCSLYVLRLCIVKQNYCENIFDDLLKSIEKESEKEREKERFIIKYFINFEAFAFIKQTGISFFSLLFLFVVVNQK